jgi:hypothetical protein
VKTKTNKPTITKNKAMIIERALLGRWPVKGKVGEEGDKRE